MQYTDEEILKLFHLLSPSMKTAIHDIMEVTAGKADAKEKIDTMVHGAFKSSSEVSRREDQTRN